jgi:septum formation protein
MPPAIVLASASPIRATLLRNAGVEVTIAPVRIDEEMIRDSLLAESAKPRDIADTLAETKALRAKASPGAFVIGCDQVLDFQGEVWVKPATRDVARQQLATLRGQTHSLLSAIVIVQDGQPLWRHLATARLTMRAVSESYLDGYLDRNWPQIGGSVGAYQIESEGIRLFSRIEGDYFTILGLPLLPLLDYLSLRQAIPA